MTMNYAYTPNLWPSILTVLLLITLAIYSGRRRSVPGALPFTVACLFATTWAVGSVMEYAAADLATKIFWIKFQAVWQLPVELPLPALSWNIPGPVAGSPAVTWLCCPPLRS